MQYLLPHIIEYLPSATPLRLVSKDWKDVLDTNDRAMFEGISRQLGIAVATPEDLLLEIMHCGRHPAMKKLLRWHSRPLNLDYVLENYEADSKEWRVLYYFVRHCQSRRARNSALALAIDHSMYNIVNDHISFDDRYQLPAIFGRVHWIDTDTINILKSRGLAIGWYLRYLLPRIYDDERMLNRRHDPWQQLLHFAQKAGNWSIIASICTRRKVRIRQYPC